MCGIIGVLDKESQAAYRAYEGLLLLQHRGQESAGIFAGSRELGYGTHYGYGNINIVFSPSFYDYSGGDIGEKNFYRLIKNDSPLQNLPGRIALGAVRYSTQGSKSGQYNIQPFCGIFNGNIFSLVHNGNIINTEELRKICWDKGVVFKGTTDTEVIAALIGVSGQYSFFEALKEVVGKLEGAFSLILAYQDNLYVVRDRFGIRPLAIGISDKHGWAAASETCAFKPMQGFDFFREVSPGEISILKQGTYPGIRFWTENLFGLTGKICLFEYTYFSRPDSYLGGINVHQIRQELGKILFAEEKQVSLGQAIAAVPDSGISAAMGYGQAKGQCLDQGILRTHYAGRTFIIPIKHIREDFARIKFSVNEAVVKGNDVIVIDDSIVRGTVARKIVALLKEAGAKKVHFKSSVPRIVSPCYLGIDMSTREELIASAMNMEEIQRHIGADSLQFLSSVESMVKAVNNIRYQNGFKLLSKSDFCHGCFEGGCYAC